MNFAPSLLKLVSVLPYALVQLSAALFMLCAAELKAEELTIVTEHWPPYQKVENGIATSGFSIAVVNAMLDEAETPQTIRGFNWARAYKMALERPNIMIIGMFRSKDRENKFKWVGKLVRQVNSMWYVRGSRAQNIKSLMDAKAYRIAVPREDIRHQFLLNNGFERNNIVVVRDHRQAVSLLYLKRTELVISDPRNIEMTAQVLGFEPGYLVQVPDLTIELGDLYIACSLKTPDAIVKKYAQALQRVKDKGIYRKLKAQMLPDHPF